MLGLDSAGKSTILYKLNLNETVTTTATTGFNVETISLSKDVKFTIWDVGGQVRDYFEFDRQDRGSRDSEFS